MKKIILAALALGLAACAPVKYQTRYAYTPPAERSGMVCTQRCAAQQNQCNKRFTVATQQCLQRAGHQAKREMPGQIAAYEKALDVWEARIRHYERDLRLYQLRRRNHSILRETAYERCRVKNSASDCRRHRPYHRSRIWFDEPMYPGKAPRRPTLASVTRYIAAKTCPQESQCVAEHNQCYAACGGVVKPYQVLLKGR